MGGEMTGYHTCMDEERSQPSSLRLMVIYAHPDDEVFAAGGTIARAAREGVEVTLLLATGGEEGEIVNPEMRGIVALADLPAVRAQELECSRATLGIHRVVRLGYRDSGMAGTPSSRQPAAFSNQDPEAVAERIVREVRAFRPHVICTEPADGGYGHPDHIALHAATVLAFDRSGERTWYPDSGEPWTPLKLYFSTWSQSMFRRLQAGYARHGLEFRFGTGMVVIDEGNAPGRPDAEIATVVDIRSTLHTKLRAMRCYRTQIMDDFFFYTAPDDVATEVLGDEYFMLGHSRVETSYPNADVFEGLRP